ncbi:hypothetical protein [Mycobacterium sp. OTB74]|jgi:hypothetical protein|uniref:hypothetical protein n=1 Tax=Mycobacterium sp. OTB74 TaxID=1853452 RepID=UPI002475B50A|nr:hypothetical protein [Mycobacterium sp. OTB74]MDH6245706.1 hypothetical protein [Mycobacterium sp. OTB74]
MTATNRYLETIKRLLSAEAYFRSLEMVEKREAQPPAREEKSKAHAPGVPVFAARHQHHDGIQ